MEFEDSFTIGDLDPDLTAALFINTSDAGSVLFDYNLVLPGQDLNITAERITVSPGITIDTRQVDNNNISTADSGDITFHGQTITLGSGARLLADAPGGAYQPGDIRLTAEGVCSNYKLQSCCLFST